jgi:putative transposase
MVSARVRRTQVAYAHARGISLRRACGLLSVARSALRYQSRLAVKDAPVLSHMRELSMQYPRFGYRRIQVFLDRIGHPVSSPVKDTTRK